MKSRKIIRVTEDEFELEDGRIFSHFEKLVEVPSIEEFQEVYDEWLKIFIEQGLIDGKIN